MRRIFFLLLFLVLSVALSAAAEPPLREFHGAFAPADNGERLLALLVSLTDPELLELRMDELPGDDGALRSVSLLVHGGSLGGFRVERLALESAFLTLNPPSEWKLGSRYSLQVRSALRSNFQLVLNERDIQEALIAHISESWNDIVVKVNSGKLYARSSYNPGDSGGGILTEMRTNLELRGGKHVRLKSPSISINGADSTELFQTDLERLQPIIDFADFPLPLTIALLSADKQKVVFATRTLPEPVEGIVYRYVRNPENPFSAGRPEAFEYSPDQFRNGDLVFVGGKTWRSKIVNLLEKGPEVFSHVGIVRVVKGDPCVIHASPDEELVRMESIQDFLSPLKVDHAAVYRVRDTERAAEVASLKALEYYRNKIPFDTGFDIEDSGRLYCTELIWQVYMHAGIDLADGRWDWLHNPVLNGRLLLPYRLSQNPRLTEVLRLQ